MNLLSLRYFVEVANSNSMQSAAERLHVSQSTLSISIKKLEDELGVALFSRNSRHLYLTQEGILFLDGISQILYELDTLVETVYTSWHKHRSNALMIGADAVDIANESMRAFKLSIPDANITPIYGRKETISMLLRTKQLDFFFSLIPHHFDGYTSELLFEEPMLLLLYKSHPLASELALSLRQMAQDRVILMPKGFAIRDLFEHFFIEAGLYIPHALEVASQENIPLSVNSGFGFSFIPECNENARRTHPTEIQGGGVHTVSIPLRESCCTRRVFLVYRMDFRPGSLAEQYLNYVRNYSAFIREYKTLPVEENLSDLLQT